MGMVGFALDSEQALGVWDVDRCMRVAMLWLGSGWLMWLMYRGRFGFVRTLASLGA